MGFHVLVLAGGSGTRLWPLSRGSTPKHLLPLAPGGRTLLRDTVDRVRDLADAVHVVTAAPHASACREALSGIPGRDLVISEPQARGTGPALALAVGWIMRDDPEALVSSVHADHRVSDVDGYRAAVVAAAGWALATGGLATVGITPAFASTGLGYVELGPRCAAETWRPVATAPRSVLEAAAQLPAHRAEAFVEKPDRDRAEAFVARGGHLWNLGLFAWQAPVFMREASSAAPEVAEAVAGAVAARVAGDETAATAAYAGLRTAAVEPLILERGAPLVVVRASFGWSDVGSWADLHGVRAGSGEADAAGNVLDGDAVAVDARECTVISRGGRLVTVVGTRSLVVVDTPDAVLVVPADQAQRVKEVVERLHAAGRDDVL